MAHYVDFDPCDYVRLNVARRHLALAIGWLEPGFDYRRGDVPRDFLDRLEEILLNSGDQGASYCGWHECALSDSCGERTSSPGEHQFSASSRKEIFVPLDGCLFVSPENIGHYIIAHGYAPPKVFIKAVERCPSVGSDDYHEQTWRFFRLTSQDLGPVPKTAPWLPPG